MLQHIIIYLIILSRIDTREGKLVIDYYIQEKKTQNKRKTS